jgi:phosphatidylethanolamine/phosphatidyl-N-methylethanolamine N-methyltransferase
MSLNFFKHWLAAPMTVGSVMPSSRYLADAVADGVEGFDAIIEVGAGTGSITKSLIQRHPSATLMLFELGDRLAVELSRKFPHAHVVSGSFHENVSLLQNLPAKTVIVSGLPMQSLSPHIKAPTIARFAELLLANKARRLVQFTYLPKIPFTAPPGLCWRRIKTVWRNVPPANIWQLAAKSE